MIRQNKKRTAKLRNFLKLISFYELLLPADLRRLASDGCVVGWRLSELAS